MRTLLRHSIANAVLVTWFSYARPLFSWYLNICNIVFCERDIVSPQAPKNFIIPGNVHTRNPLSGFENDGHANCWIVPKSGSGSHWERTIKSPPLLGVSCKPIGSNDHPVVYEPPQQGREDG